MIPCLKHLLYLFHLLNSRVIKYASGLGILNFNPTYLRPNPVDQFQVLSLCLNLKFVEFKSSIILSKPSESNYTKDT